MRTFSYQTTGMTTADQIQHRNESVAKQNELVKSGGATTVPQFREAGAPTGAGTNQAIQGMASKQLQMDENSKYNGCVGKAAGTCGGSRRRRTKRRKTRRKRR